MSKIRSIGYLLTLRCQLSTRNSIAWRRSIFELVAFADDSQSWKKSAFGLILLISNRDLHLNFKFLMTHTSIACFMRVEFGVKIPSICSKDDIFLDEQCSKLRREHYFTCQEKFFISLNIVKSSMHYCLICDPQTNCVEIPLKLQNFADFSIPST